MFLSPILNPPHPKVISKVECIKIVLLRKTSCLASVNQSVFGFLSHLVCKLEEYKKSCIEHLIVDELHL